MKILEIHIPEDFVLKIKDCDFVYQRDSGCIIIEDSSKREIKDYDAETFSGFIRMRDTSNYRVIF